MALVAFVASALWVGDGWLVLLCGVALVWCVIEFCLAWYRWLNR